MCDAGVPILDVLAAFDSQTSEHFTSSQMGCVADSVAVQKPFLLELQFGLYEYHREPILPDPFLGRTAPRLLDFRNYCCLHVPHCVHLVCLDLLNG